MMDVLARQQKIYSDPVPLTVEHPEPGRVDEAFFKHVPAKKKGKS